MAAPRSRSRRILRSPSLTSLASSLSSLSLSLYTTTSSRTLWGPGALAGKAILALGKATVRGAERVVIHRRLAVIHANLPCRDDDAAFDSDVHAAFFVGLFDDLLELSRPGLYGDGIRHSAMEIILIQIASSQTTHLINCLSQWMLDDLMLLILEIMSVALFSHSGFLEPRLVDAYTSATAGTTGTTIGRVLGGVPGRAITFISALARQNQIACEAALLCGFLEMLLLTASQLGDMNQEDEDRDALNSAFTALHQSAKRIEHSDSDLADLWHSRLEAFWPAEVHPPSTAFEVAANVTKTAPHTWLAIEAEFLQREAACLVRQSSPPRCPMHAGRTLSDASPFPRMSNMTLSNSAVPEMRWKDVLEAGFAASRALWHLMACVVLGGDVRAPMLEHLRTQTHREKVSLLSRMVYLLMPHTREARSLESRSLCARIGGHATLHSRWSAFILELTLPYPILHLAGATPQKFQDRAAEDNKAALWDAILTLLVPLLKPSATLDPVAVHSDLFSRSNFFPSAKRRPSYGKHTKRVLEIMKLGRLREVIDSEYQGASSGELRRVPGAYADWKLPRAPKESLREIAGVLEEIFNGC